MSRSSRRDGASVREAAPSRLRSASSPLRGVRSLASPTRASSAGGDRAQTEPLAALVAVLAVCSGLTLYAAVAPEATPGSEPETAAPAMERLAATAVEDGTVAPESLPDPAAVVRGGRRARITLTYDGGVERSGPEPPDDAARESRPVAVRVRPGDRRPGRLTVEVWT